MANEGHGKTRHYTAVFTGDDATCRLFLPQAEAMAENMLATQLAPSTRKLMVGDVEISVQTLAVPPHIVRITAGGVSVTYEDKGSPASSQPDDRFPPYQAHRDRWLHGAKYPAKSIRQDYYAGKGYWYKGGKAVSWRTQPRPDGQDIAIGDPLFTNPTSALYIDGAYIAYTNRNVVAAALKGKSHLVLWEKASTDGQWHEYWLQGAAPPDRLAFRQPRGGRRLLDARFSGAADFFVKVVGAFNSNGVSDFTRDYAFAVVSADGDGPLTETPMALAVEQNEAKVTVVDTTVPLPDPSAFPLGATFAQTGGSTGTVGLAVAGQGIGFLAGKLVGKKFFYLHHKLTAASGTETTSKTVNWVVEFHGLNTWVKTGESATASRASQLTVTLYMGAYDIEAGTNDPYLATVDALAVSGGGGGSGDTRTSTAQSSSNEAAVFNIFAFCPKERLVLYSTATTTHARQSNQDNTSGTNNLTVTFSDDESYALWSWKDGAKAAVGSLAKPSGGQTVLSAGGDTVTFGLGEPSYLFTANSQYAENGKLLVGTAAAIDQDHLVALALGDAEVLASVTAPVDGFSAYKKSSYSVTS